MSRTINIVLRRLIKLVLTIKDLPEELTQPIKALTDETRRKILLSLLETDAFSYSQIQNVFQIKKGTLNHHLHILVSAGLIRNFSIKTLGNPYNSYYAITNFGRKFIEGLHQTLETKKARRTITHTSTTTLEEEMIIGSASEGEEKYTLVETVIPEIPVRS